MLMIVPKIVSVWTLERYSSSGALIHRMRQHNVVTNEGLTALLSVMFKGGTQITDWYVALFKNDYTPAVGDTYASHGMIEATEYNETTRRQWNGGSIVNRVVSNSASKAEYTMNDEVTIHGGMLIGGGSSPSTKGDTAGGGTLYAAAKFIEGSRAAAENDIVKITVTLQQQ